MKYLGILQGMKAFTLADVATLTKNARTAQSVLLSYKRAGYITSVRRNVYAALDLATKTCIAHPYEIASTIQEDASVSYHSAMEYHGLANQVFFTVYVTSPLRFSEFSFDGMTYQHCTETIKEGLIRPTLNPHVRVTDLERTVIDCIDDIGRAGGLEELVQCLSLVAYLNEEKLITYLNAYNKVFLWQKTGYVLEQLSSTLHTSKEFLDMCKSHVRECKKYLVKENGLTYFPTWKLYAPKYLLGLLNEEESQLV